MDEFDVPRDELDVTMDEFDVTMDEFDVTRDEFDVPRDELDVMRDEFNMTRDEFDVTIDEFDVTKDEFDVKKVMALSELKCEGESLLGTEWVFLKRDLKALHRVAELSAMRREGLLASAGPNILFSDVRFVQSHPLISVSADNSTITLREITT
ncbi:hypothetical protein CDL15_Pgr001460 [Punica granatum]|uniref:Uncharacterized protein n=1 Tax=Punica granatum TaxID=22663 RepID=A0A218WL25_PUNGR|nr:hypothetical protein CDL15_Pgr001460 [Punica granatum]